MSKNYLVRIKDTMGPEAAMAFMEAVNALDLNPDDPELLLAACNASFVVSLAEIPKRIEAERAKVEAVFARFLADVDLKVAEAMTKAVDEMHTEVRTMARELAMGEYTAAASLRSTAINDEVRALRAATGDLERATQAATAHGIATGEAPEHDATAAHASTGGISPRRFVLVAAALVIGVLLGAFFTKRSYEGWHAPAHHTAAAPVQRAAASAAIGVLRRA